MTTQAINEWMGSSPVYNARIRALHRIEGDGVDVISVIPSLDEIARYGAADKPDNVRLENCQQHIAQYLVEHGHGPLSAHCLIGDPGTMIINYASDVKADLIVMPSHGRHGLKRLVLGSTTERVLRHTEIPVLVLRE